MMLMTSPMTWLHAYMVDKELVPVPAPLAFGGEATLVGICLATNLHPSGFWQGGGPPMRASPILSPPKQFLMGRQPWLRNFCDQRLVGEPGLQHETTKEKMLGQVSLTGPHRKFPLLPQSVSSLWVMANCLTALTLPLKAGAMLSHHGLPPGGLLLFYKVKWVGALLRSPPGLHHTWGFTLSQHKSM